MQTKILSGDLENVWIIQPISGGIRYVHKLPFWYLSFSLPWEYAQIKELTFISHNVSGGEIYYTPSVSVEGYEIWGMEGLCLEEDERHQKPFIHTICFSCTLTDGRYFLAETNPDDWTKWQKMAAEKPAASPISKSNPPSTSCITKVAIYLFLCVLALSALGAISEAITNTIKTQWPHSHLVIKLHSTEDPSE